MKRCHHMPFGTEIEPDGVRFRLWAPSAATVELLVDGAPPRPMDSLADGWRERVEPAAGPGSRYRFRIGGDLSVPDPASRCQPEDVGGPSLVIDPAAFEWADDDWRGRPWEEVVLYELHVGAFTPEGSFAAVEHYLDDLADLGVTAIELMPLADFAGRRGWGYDGVLPFAPDASYGRPEDLKRLVQAAHARRLMVFLDVVYNHFGPEGNYLHAYAAPFFTRRHHTPWGDANNFDGPGSRTVRDFFIENALYWIEEYHLDGLRLDAVHAILDDSPKHFLVELAERVRATFADRHVHLVLENDANQARYLLPGLYDAQWNDDFHHVLHLLASGETAGYYRDYRAAPLEWLGRALTKGFAYQGELSEHRSGRPRGEPSAHLPATRFVAFLQNHDQIGNRAMGERLSALATAEVVEASLAILLLCPSIPLLFMGEEWGSRQPFLYFCDFRDELGAAVRDGRRREFEQFPQFADAPARLGIPDPNAEATFLASKLDRPSRHDALTAGRTALIRRLLALRHADIVPRLKGLAAEAGFAVERPHLLRAWWRLADGSTLDLQGNLGPAPIQVAGPLRGRLLYSSHGRVGVGAEGNNLPPWAVTWCLA